VLHTEPPDITSRIELDRAGGWDISPVSSHGLSLGDAIGLARALDRMPERLILHAVEAADFRLGVGFTPAVAAAVAPLKKAGWPSRLYVNALTAALSNRG
jgi:hydrogenase maturation protease